MLGKILADTLKEQNLSGRELAKKIGIAPATFFRVLRGDTADVETLIKISKYTGVALYSLIGAIDPNEDRSLESSIAVIVAASPELKEVFIEMKRDIEAGELSVDDLRDIVSFAKYKLKK